MSVAGFNGNLLFQRDVGAHLAFIVSMKYIDEFKAIVTLTNDSYVTVWTLRHNNQYWPGISYFLQAPGTCLDISPNVRQAFTGLENGKISVIVMSYDLNYVSSERYISDHTPFIPIKAIKSDARSGLVFSINQQGELICLNIFSNEVLIKKNVCSNPTDIVSNHISRIFVSEDFIVNDIHYGIESGKAYIDSIDRLQSKHRGHIVHLKWCDEWNTLAAASSCGAILLWTFVGSEVKNYILKWHNDIPTSIEFFPHYQQIVSLDAGGNFCVWNMAAKREEMAKWKNLNACSNCNTPFFWNFKLMFSQKTLGKRRHHCRSCGRSLCEKCSPHSTVMPSKGWEVPVRVCSECYKEISSIKQESLINYSRTNSSCHLSAIYPQSNLILTSNLYFPIRLWNIQTNR